MTLVPVPLSMVARLMVELRDWLGPAIHLSSVRWINSVTGRKETATFDSVPAIGTVERRGSELPDLARAGAP